jgi:hypothetical protein
VRGTWLESICRQVSELHKVALCGYVYTVGVRFLFIRNKPASGAHQREEKRREEKRREEKRREKKRREEDSQLHHHQAILLFCVEYPPLKS